MVFDKPRARKHTQHTRTHTVTLRIWKQAFAPRRLCTELRAAKKKVCPIQLGTRFPDQTCHTAPCGEPGCYTRLNHTGWVLHHTGMTYVCVYVCVCALPLNGLTPVALVVPPSLKVRNPDKGTRLAQPFAVTMIANSLLRSSPVAGRGPSVRRSSHVILQVVIWLHKSAVGCGNPVSP